MFEIQIGNMKSFARLISAIYASSKWDMTRCHEDRPLRHIRTLQNFVISPNLNKKGNEMNKYIISIN